MALHSLFYPAQSLDSELQFFQQGLGLTTRFRDGARFVALPRHTRPAVRRHYLRL